MTDGVEVLAVASAATYPLRTSVLRNNTPDRDPRYPGDDEPSTRHLAIRADDRLVAVSTWIATPFPGEPGDVGVQLRGMATDPASRGRGYGRLMLDAGLAYAAELGARTVWARARVTALSFYLANGFSDVGDDFIDETSGLPHRLVRTDVT